MSWKFQAIRYLWGASASASPQFSLALPDVLEGAQGWRGPDERPLPISHLFALQGRLNAGALSWDATGLQHHVRGQDLIVEYPYSDETPTGVECYWRPQELAEGAIAVEWVVSANTRLLDENIEWLVESVFQVASIEVGNTDDSGACSEFVALGNGSAVWESSATTWESPLVGQKVLLMKLADDAGWLTLATAPGDQRQLRVDVAPDQRGGQRVAVRYELQMGFLEKGVIRRARLWCLWLPSNQFSLECLRRHLHEFYCSPQPLTV